MPEIPASPFGATVDMLSNALYGASLNQDQIADNIANAQTPGFHRSTVSFKEALARTAGTPADPNQLPMLTDDDRQFALGDAQPPASFDPQPQVDDTTQMRADGSNVDVDQEMGELAQNSAYSQTMAQLLSTEFGIYHSVITEQPR